MSRNRHLYTVGEKVFRTTLRRCNTADVFERDPFKIQSYNFRYAERPAYTVQQYRRPESTATRLPDLAFETYYYNRNFDRRHVKDNHNLMYEVGVNNASKFQDYRRRKFLYDVDIPRNVGMTICGGSGGVNELPKRQANAVVQPKRRTNYMHSRGGAIVAAGDEMGNMSNFPLHSFCQSKDCLHTVNNSSSSCIASRSSNFRQHSSNSCRKFAKECNDIGGFGGKKIHLLQSSDQASIQSKNGNHEPKGINFGSCTCLACPSSSSLLGDQCNYQNTLHPVTKSHSVQHLPKYQNISDVNRKKITLNCQSQPLRSQQLSMKLSTNVLNAMQTPKKSSCSGCEININICAVDNEKSNENVLIKIETDECKLENTNRKMSFNNKSNNVGFDKQRSADSIKIDKHLSQYSIKYSNKNTIREENVEERERARERERRREKLRILERKLDIERLLEVEYNREMDRQRELEREKDTKMLHNLCDLEVARMQEKGRHLLSPPLVVMKSHLYRQASTDRIPSMVPFVTGPSTKLNCTPKSPNARLDSTRKGTTGSVPLKTTTISLSPLMLASSTSSNGKSNKKSNNTRARRVQATSCILNNLRDLKHSDHAVKPTASQALNTTHLSSPQSCERKLLNIADPFHTSLNNVPIRITSLTRRMPSQQSIDVAFSTIHVQSVSPNLRCGQSIKNSIVAPYNVNINVYADNMKKMPI